MSGVEHSQLPLLGFRGRPGCRCTGRPRNRYGCRAEVAFSLALGESGIVAAHWLTEADVDFYASEFARTRDFVGG